MLPVYSSKGQVSAGALLFVVNTKKSEKEKESSKTEHGGENSQSGQMRFKVKAKCQEVLNLKLV